MPEKEILNFANDIEVQSVEWLWYPYIPSGKISIMQGSSGIGKTMLMLNIAAALSNGEMLPGDTTPREPINITYNTAEDGLGDTIKPRLLAAGADCTRINTINERVSTISMTDERIENSIAELSAKLLILDPIQAYLGSKIDMNKANEIRPIFAHLGRVAEDHGCAIVLIGHEGKNSLYSDLQKLLGSTDQVAAARSVLSVIKHPHNNALSLISHTKSSLAAKGQSLSFYIDSNGKIVWGDFIDNLDPAGTEEKATKRDLAKDFLLETLTDGSKSANEIVLAAHEKQISDKTLQRGKKELGIISYSEGGMWFWKLPQK